MGPVSQANCIFCKIVNHEIPESEIVYESENVTVFKDIRPASNHHYLAVPKKHIENVKNLTDAHKPLLVEMKMGLDAVFEKNRMDFNDVSYGFHWPPFNTIAHLHLHGIAPASKMTFIARIIFKPNNWWFCTYEYVMQRIEKKSAAK